MPKTKKQELGAWGENQAVAFLLRRGYEVVDRNVLIDKGEIDIVAWHDKYHHGRTLCFLEVKTRTYGMGNAERATVGQKLGVLMRTAQFYCSRHSISIDAVPIQFEQVSVYIDKNRGTLQIMVYEIPM